MQILSPILAVVFATLVTLGLMTNEARAEKIEVWTFIGAGEGNVREKAVAAVVQSFKAKYPNIEVSLQVMPWQQLSPTLMRAAKAGQVPDVAMLYSPSMPGHIAAGTLSPLKPYIDAWPAEVRSDLVQLPETLGKGGVAFGVPWDMRVAGLAYRADLLKAAGKRPPQSLQEWADTAAAVGKGDIAGIALGFGQDAPSNAAGWFLTTLVGSGAKVLNPDGTAAFVSPQAERLVQWVKDLTKRNALPQSVALQGLESVQQLFVAHKAAFLPTSTVKFEFIADRSKLGENMKMIAYPGFEEGRPSPALVQSWSLVIPKGAKQPAAAWKFIDHWTSTKVQADSARIGGYVPVRRSALSDPWFKQPKAEMVRWALDYASKNPLVFTFPENTDALYDTWAKMFGQVLTDKMSPREALVWAEAEYNRRGKR
jgi:ABC-type glycerol-3-phosphate transport system substrate-binding protein